MIARRCSALALLLLAGACTAVPQAARPVSRPVAPGPGPGSSPRPGIVAIPPQTPPPPAVAGFRAPDMQGIAGLDWLYQRDARALASALGAPRLDVTEGDMRKLQFSGTACVLDVFLYPLRPGGEPVATHVEARRGSDGQEVDRRSCADALRRR